MVFGCRNCDYYKKTERKRQCLLGKNKHMKLYWTYKEGLIKMDCRKEFEILETANSLIENINKLISYI